MTGAFTTRISVRRRVLSACERFEDGWKRGGGPTIEDLLAEAHEGDRPPLLRELLGVEIELRNSAGQAPTLDEYLGRFPADGRLVEAVYLEVAEDEARSGNQRPTVPDRPTDGSEAPGKPAAPPTSRARYRFLRPLARGGLGQVSVAYDEELRREVALKEIRATLADDPRCRVRFVTEAEVTGGLQHPGVVPVYGLGTYPDGRPYYAMRLVLGQTLKKAIKEFHGTGKEAAGPRDPGGRALALHKLLTRFVSVCDAVAYAHSKGVIHRDIKPENVMIGHYGEALVVDWGLAKVIAVPDEGAAESPLPAEDRPIPPGALQGESPTEYGSALGTPQYMSPEQAGGDHGRVGPASDIYSLGATLYCLLTGRPPVDERDTDLAVKRAKEGDFPAPRKVSRAVPAVLESVCLKAMAREPADRYSTAADLADDVERWLADEPVSAHREGLPKRLARMAKRNKTAVAVISAVLLTAGAAALIGLDAVRQQRKEAERSQQLAAIEAQAARLSAVRELRWKGQPGWSWAALDLLETAARSPYRDAAALRSEAAACLGATDLRLTDEFAVGVNAAALAYSPDGGLLAIGEFKAQLYRTCRVRVVTSAGGRTIGDFQTTATVLLRNEGGLPRPSNGLLDIIRGEPLQDGTRAVGFSPDGRLLLAGLRSGRVVVWDVSKGGDAPPVADWQAHTQEVTRLFFSPDGATLYTCGEDDTARSWDARNGWASRSKVDAVDLALAVGPARVPVVYAAATGSAVVPLDPATLGPGEPLVAGGADRVESGPGGRFLATRARGEILLIDPADPGPGRRLIDPMIGRSHEGEVSAMAVSPDGALLASVSDAFGRRDLRLWDVASGRLIAALPVRGTDRVRLAFHPDGGTLAVTADKRTLLYEARSGGVRLTVANQAGPVRALALTPDGSTVVTATMADLSAWSVAGGDRVSRTPLPSGPARANPPGLAVGPRGERVAVYGQGASATLMPVSWAGAPVPVPIKDATVLTFAPGGTTVYGVSGQEKVYSWEVGTPTPTLLFDNALYGRISGLAEIDHLAAGPGCLVAGGRDGVVRALDPAEKAADRSWNGEGGPVRALAVSPDGKVAAAGGQSGGLSLFDLKTGAALPSPPPSSSAITGLAFSGDARRLVRASADGGLTLFDFDGERLQERLSLIEEGRGIEAVALSDDGAVLAVLVRGEHAVRVWRLDRLGLALKRLGLSPPDAPVSPRP